MHDPKEVIKELSLMHDVSTIAVGESVILQQLIEGLHGSTLEDIKPILVCLLSSNNKARQMLDLYNQNQRLERLLGITPSGIKEFSMSVFLQKLTLEYMALAKSSEKKLYYQTQTTYLHGTSVVGDVILIYRMLSNLLQNAIKYTKSGDIFLRLLNCGDDLVVTIEDTGIGIEPEELTKIFVPFYRCVNSASSEASGSGLGLYIAMMVACEHGLKLTVDSVVGKGTVFTIRFPYKVNSPYGLDVKILPKNERLQYALPI